MSIPQTLHTVLRDFSFAETAMLLYVLGIIAILMAFLRRNQETKGRKALALIASIGLVSTFVADESVANYQAAWRNYLHTWALGGEPTRPELPFSTLAQCVVALVCCLAAGVILYRTRTSEQLIHRVQRLTGVFTAALAAVSLLACVIALQLPILSTGEAVAFDVQTYTRDGALVMGAAFVVTTVLATFKNYGDMRYEEGLAAGRNEMPIPSSGVLSVTPIEPPSQWARPADQQV